MFSDLELCIAHETTKMDSLKQPFINGFFKTVIHLKIQNQVLNEFQMAQNALKRALLR